MADTGDVLRLSDIDRRSVDALLGRYRLVLERLPDHAPIEGSFWGEPEAGIVAGRLLVRDDTPVHSLLHELCHVVCMTLDRRYDLHGDAGGDDLEESAVCYLQIVLAESLPGVGSARLMRDMDRWGYSFRLGSAEKWFKEDAEDARAFLEEQGLLFSDGRPTWAVRT